MRYLATENGLVLAERERVRVPAPELWIPRDSSVWDLPPLEAFGVAGGFATTQMAVGGNDLWQPLGIPGFILDLDPRFNTTIDSSSGFPHVSSITNVVGGRSDAFVNGNDSLRPTFEATGWTSSRGTHPSLIWDGVADYSVCTSSLASTLFGGLNTAFTLVFPGEFLSTTGTQAPVFAGKVASNQPIWDFYLTTGPNWQSNKRGDSGTLTFISGGTASTGKHLFALVHSGTSLNIYVDDMVTPVASGSQSTVTMTVDCMSLGATFGNSSPANWANIRIPRFFGFTGALGATDLGTVTAMAKQLYF